MSNVEYRGKGNTFFQYEKSVKILVHCVKCCIFAFYFMAKKGDKNSSKITNPHDAFFKGSFSYVDVAEDYIKHFLPKSLVEGLDLSSLKLENNDFVNNDLSEFFSDLIWECEYRTTKVKNEHRKVAQYFPSHATRSRYRIHQKAL